jgi:hypothetical protein
MCCCGGIDRSCPGFYLTEEEIKAFIAKVKMATKYLFTILTKNNKHLKIQQN